MPFPRHSVSIMDLEQRAKSGLIPAPNPGNSAGKDAISMI